MQTQTTTQAQLRVGGILSNVWKKESWRGLFAGNGANCVRVLPFSALVCLAYYNMAKVSIMKSWQFYIDMIILYASPFLTLRIEGLRTIVV